GGGVALGGHGTPIADVKETAVLVHPKGIVTPQAHGQFLRRDVIKSGDRADLVAKGGDRLLSARFGWQLDVGEPVGLGGPSGQSRGQREEHRKKGPNTGETQRSTRHQGGPPGVTRHSPIIAGKGAADKPSSNLQAPKSKLQ